ncbi:MAG: hypothetical protein AAF658_13100, partial [Myxococcota bacterium]
MRRVLEFGGAVGIALGIAGCTQSLDTLDGAAVACMSDEECPQQGRCDPVQLRCVFPGQSQQIAPTIQQLTVVDTGFRPLTLVPIEAQISDANAPIDGTESITIAIEFSTDGNTWLPANVSGETSFEVGATATQVSVSWNALGDATSGVGDLNAITVDDSGDGVENADIVDLVEGVQLRLSATDST